MTNKYARILQEARRLIKHGHTSYVCHAISDVALPNRSVYKLIHWIRDSLEGRATVEGWLNAHGVSPQLMTDSVMREYRLRWIDSMIEQVKTWK